MMTSHCDHYSFLTKVMDLFGGWRRELDQLMEYGTDSDELERVARELSVAPGELEMLVRLGSRGAKELPEMLAAVGIYETAVWHEEPALLRDMERVCSFCRDKRRCRRELAAGTAAASYVEFCRNADTFDALRFES